MTNATAARGAAAGQVRWWVAGDWNGFFGLFTNVLLNVIVLTGLCLGVVQLPADTVFGRVLPALGIALPLGNLFYAYLAWQLAQEGGPHRRHRDAVRPERAAHVHRRVRDHAAGLPEDEGPHPRLAGRARLVLHHRRHRAARRLRRAVDPRDDAARGDARHARRHLDRVHLDAPGVPDVGSAVDRLRLLRHRADRAGPRTSGCRAAFPAGSPRCIVGIVDRLGVAARRLERLHEAARAGKSFETSSACTCRVLDRRVRPAWPTSRRCSPPRSRSASTTSPRR